MINGVKSIGIITLLILGSFLGFITIEPGVASALTTRSPILIIGNENFTSANGVTSGNGTEADPYIIDGWEINASTEVGIDIRNTTAHFIIRNVTVHSGETYYNYKEGIYLTNLSNGRISNCSLINNTRGIYLVDVSDTIIKENTLSSRYGDGIVLDASKNNKIIKNTLIDHESRGILLTSSSDDNIISFNNISSGHLHGISIRYSSGNHIDNNHFFSIPGPRRGNAIYLHTADDNDILNNNITKYNEGIFITANSGETNSNNNISNNFIQDYYFKGISLCYSRSSIITNNQISFGGHGIYMTLYSYDNKINSNEISNMDNNAIYLQESSNNEISSNNITNNYVGMFINDDSNFNTITNNNVSYNEYNGIIFISSNFNKIRNNIINSNYDIGIDIRSFSDNTEIANNEIKYNEDGIYVHSSSHLEILNNTISSNTYIGIYCYIASMNNDIINNTIINNDDGVILSGVIEYNIKNNNISYNTRMGIDLWTSEKHDIENNDLYSNGYKSINIQSSSNLNNVFNNKLIAYNARGIHITDSYSNNITGNVVKGSQLGIVISESGYNTFKQNEIFNTGFFIDSLKVDDWITHEIDTTNKVNGKPVYYWPGRDTGTIQEDAGQVILANCKNIVVSDLDVSDTSTGITVGFSSDCIISNNLANHNYGNGISLLNSQKNIIQNNSVSYNSDHGISVYGSHENIIRNNTGKNNSCGIYQFSSSDSNIEKNIFNNNRLDGIYSFDSPDLIIDNNTCNFNKRDGFHIVTTYRSIIKNNMASSNDYNGMSLGDINYAGIEISVIKNNIIQSNGLTGLSLQKPRANSIENNSISFNGNIGLLVEYENNNTITENTIMGNEKGIYVSHTLDNLIYHNNFIDNSNNSFVNAGRNYWDNAYPKGGNYWSDYTGDDEYSGDEQNKPGRDGIIDSPLVFDQNNTDYYPLTKPYRQKPSSPRNVTATSGFSFINLTWEPPTEEGTFPISYYSIYRSTVSQEEKHFKIVFENSLFFNDTSVENGVTYYYKIIARHRAAKGLFSEEVSAMPGVVPSEPRDLFVFDQKNYINITWDIPGFDGGIPVTNFRIYKGITEDLQDFLIEVENVSFYQDKNVSAGVQYYYKVCAVNIKGPGPFSELANTTIPTEPSPPINLAVTAGDSFINLTWEIPLNDGGRPIEFYYIYRRILGEDLKAIQKLVSTIQFYNDTEVTNGITYYYKVRASNEEGKGQFSLEISATPNLIIIENKAPKALISVNNTKGSTPFLVNFKGSGLDNDGSIVSYFWDFGDGTNSTEENPSHVYFSPGTFYVKLTVTDDKGDSGISMVTITVEPRDIPQQPDDGEDDKSTKGSSVLPVGTIITAGIILIILGYFLWPMVMRKKKEEEEEQELLEQKRVVREITVIRTQMRLRTKSEEEPTTETDVGTVELPEDENIDDQTDYFHEANHEELEDENEISKQIETGDDIR